MPMYDFECKQCGVVEEKFYTISDLTNKSECECGGEMHRIFTIGHGAITHNDNAEWIRTVTDVVDKDPNKPHCQEFLKNPTRSNYKKWMKGEGIRPMEKGEYTTHKNNVKKQVTQKEKSIEKQVLKNHKKRNSIKAKGDKQVSHPAQ